nr:hypothetical protein B0A51_16723 [Rachicladosporium sp. CCFEE 5018]
MSHAIDSKSATAELIDPFNAPEPSAETGPGASFGSTFAGLPDRERTTTAATSKNPYHTAPPAKSGAQDSTRPLGARGSPPTKFPNFSEEPVHDRSARPHRTSDAAAALRNVDGGEGAVPSRRRGSSLAQRFPGDESHKPLDIIRRDSRKANRSSHLKKKSIQGPDVIDRLDPALGGRAYHHEGPYDAAAFARNRDPKTAPIAALEDSIAETLKATPRENIKDAVERHKPLDGVAIVPPGEPDQFGRRYDYEEGTDMMREGLNNEPGYKQWPGKEYDPEDLKGEAEPGFSLNRALKAHKIDDNGIEMEDHAAINRDYHRAERKGTLDARDPVTIAGDDRKYAELAHANDTDLHHNEMHRKGSIKQSLKQRIGSLRRKPDHDE